MRHSNRKLTRGNVLGRANWSVASSRPALSSTASRCLRPSRPCTTLVRSRQSMQLVRTTPRCRSCPSACEPSLKNPSRWKSSFSWSHSKDKLQRSRQRLNDDNWSFQRSEHSMCKRDVTGLRMIARRCLTQVDLWHVDSVVRPSHADNSNRLQCNGSVDVCV